MIHKQGGGNRNSLWWSKDIRLMFVHTRSVVLSTAFTNTNVHEAQMAPVLLQNIEATCLVFLLQTLAMIANIFIKLQICGDIFPVNPINPRNGEQINSSHRRCVITFCHTTFGKHLIKSVGKLEQDLVNSKITG